MNRESAYPPAREPLIGLDERPRPASPRERVRQGLAQSAPFSSLQRRIILFNFAGLVFLVVGVFYLGQFRTGLIEQRVRTMQTLGEVISLTIAQEAGRPGGGLDPLRAERSLARVVGPTGLRGQLFDRNLAPVADTGERGAAGSTAMLAGATGGEPGVLHDLVRWLERISAPPTDTAAAETARSIREELAAALDGRVIASVRPDASEQTVIAVAHPVGHGTDRDGALLLTTQGEDINAIVRAERVAIIQVFILAVIVSVGLSVVLANTIARPIRRLAEAAAEGGQTSPARPVGPERVQIPAMDRRSDEIGDLAVALRRMTDALYARIEAIESFASDVAHEIKNPLTSLRSAVETMAYARTPEQRQQLLDVIQQDVGRMDRLVTDISNASRLDAELVRERMAPFDLAELCRGLTNMIADRAETAGVRVVLDLPAGPLTALGLEGRIAQVITNFLDNALSFSEEGGTVRLAAREVEEGGVWVSVADDGPGVPGDNLEQVFSRFYTERPEAQGFGTHSGLGLAISRQIVEAHGGRIWVENAPDADGPKGAHFQFQLPGSP